MTGSERRPDCSSTPFEPRPATTSLRDTNVRLQATGAPISVGTQLRRATPPAGFREAIRAAKLRSYGLAIAASATPLALERAGRYTVSVNTGGDMASTQVAKPQVHAEDVAYLVNHATKKIVANDDNYALAA